MTAPTPAAPPPARAEALASAPRGPGRLWAGLRGASGPLLMVTGLVAAGVLLRSLGLQDAVGKVAGAGPLSFVLVASLACAVGLPRQAVAYAAGYAYGLWPGLAASVAAMMLGCVADFGWARLLARRWVAGRLRGRALRLDALLGARPFAATLTLRLLPVGSNLLLNLAAGVSGMRAAPFLAGSLVGYAPQAAVFALFGSGTLGRPSEFLLGGVLLVASLLMGWQLLRRQPPSVRAGDPAL